MSFAALALDVGRELAEMAKQETGVRELQRVVRTRDAVLRIAALYETYPSPMSFKAFAAWREPLQKRADRRVHELELELTMLRRELAELRQEVATRDRAESERIDVILRRAG